MFAVLCIYIHSLRAEICLFRLFVCFCAKRKKTLTSHTKPQDLDCNIFLMASNAVVRRDYWRGDESESDSESDDEPEETLKERITENSKRLYNVTSAWSKWGWQKVNCR